MTIHLPEQQPAKIEQIKTLPQAPKDASELLHDASTDRPETLVTPVDDTVESQSFLERHWKRALGALGALALAIGGGAAAYNYFVNGNTPNPTPSATGEAFPGTSPDVLPSEDPQPETGSESEAYIIPLEKLATMTPEQITELSTITVESVTVNGKIDWKLYGQKLNDIIDLYLSSGTSTQEMEDAYNNEINPESYITKYDAPFKAGFAAPGLEVDGYTAMHEGVAIASYKGMLVGADPIVSASDILELNVINPSETGATLEMTLHNYNNFFSSGALNADSEKDVAQAGMNADLNTTTKGIFVAEVQGATIKLVDVQKIS